MDYWDRNIEKKSSKHNKTIVCKNECACASSLCKSGNAPKKVVFVVELDAVRRAKIMSYAVRKLKMKQYAKGGGFTLTHVCAMLNVLSVNTQ